MPSRRSGGRGARRAAPLDDTLRPVRPGMEGGTLNVVSPAQIEKIHHATLEALEEIGLADAPQSGIDYMTAVGAVLGEDGWLRFPRALVEDTLARARKEEILANPSAVRFDQMLDAEIRKAFKIHLPM